MYTDAKKVEIIAFIVDAQSAHQNDDNGDKYLSSANYAMEAIEAVINDTDSPILRMFLESATEVTS
jgi:hypothetical protein